jgi:translation initiation factor IF-1
VRLGDIVVIEWVDAQSDSSEIRAHEASDCPRVKTYGELLEVTDKHVRIAGERLDQNNGDVTYRAVTTVPKAWAKIRKLA